ncbi:MAG: hypothetical protein BRC47_14225 [Cyanobacteria bacterium QS_7_48_42]|jgi:hypothetical protein|nr:MAG: hypothetical protein BRC35_11455 [Cyanobacteria bacterium QH_10_48_56]PSO56726.1 MAG: hypothetical protein BRC34_02520 [Cyanobacteria bacterium QH_1_48_107]PSO60859.1 MAG: hypothetical protein BRC39_09080 [Cyanobacteria bacterium QH_7_48_89]PSO64706.1 MAG: hypothetical protein BRC38_10820 [Cyanobacteria bacterium QH_6_48_35]PSO66621.1 MAG: hypothetical protein BRC36_00645 [Cyanobacteria bacterium QH_2_48_84]PSO73442.1 MAG: hypothetical protein BRC37_09535 [Cyanobacteria bacterium QH_3_
MHSHSGKPKLLSVGIAGHGIIAIGVSAHGIVAIGIAAHGIFAIGIIPMGIVSLGVVSMGLASVGAVSMGLATASPMGMGFLKYPKKEMPGMERSAIEQQNLPRLINMGDTQSSNSTFEEGLYAPSTGKDAGMEITLPFETFVPFSAARSQNQVYEFPNSVSQQTHLAHASGDSHRLPNSSSLQTQTSLTTHLPYGFTFLALLFYLLSLGFKTYWKSSKQARKL